MNKFRRSNFLLVSFEQLPNGDHQSDLGNLVLTAIVTGEHLLAHCSELEKLCSIGTEEWTDLATLESLGFHSARIAQLTRLGVFISDSEDELSVLIRSREDALRSSHWPPAASIFHLLNHHRESRMVPFGKVAASADNDSGAPARAMAFVAAHGPPPGPFFSHDPASPSIDLPLEVKETPLLATLLRRRTCREFDTSRPVLLATLANLLRVVFGAWAKRLLPGVGELLLKTSPSGGSLHPIEAYPVLYNCTGLDAGIYHYRVQDHALEKVLLLPEVQLRNLGVFWGQGQDFVGSCALLVVLVARFDRNFWKYRERENSYSVVLQEAGHLGQTFQLVATDLGLGSFFTGAINSESICRVLNLDYPAQAPVGMLGAGHFGGQAWGVEIFAPRQ